MILDAVLAAGVIEDAPTFASLLTRVLGFLLEVFGIIAILGMILVGLMYLSAADDKKQLLQTKKAFWNILIGICAAFGALVLVRQIASYF